MATEEEKKDKCDYCAKEAIMGLHNLKNDVKKKMCHDHFAEFVTQGQSKVYEQFVMAMSR